MKVYKVFNVGSRSDSGWIRNAEIVHDANQADIITFPGGSDIHPGIYGDVVGSHTWCYEHADTRDLSFAKDPKLKDKFKIGLCRGAQLLTAVSGGKLVQHFTHGHGGGHGMMIDNDPKNIIPVNSLHHQMMFPFGLPESEYQVIGRACNNNGQSLAEHFLNGMDEEIGMPTDKFGFIEPETVFYPRTKSLCFQFHPEMMSWERNHKTLEFCNDLLDKLYR